MIRQAAVWQASEARNSSAEAKVSPTQRCISQRYRHWSCESSSGACFSGIRVKRHHLGVARESAQSLASRRGDEGNRAALPVLLSFGESRKT
jgi:hypothetical protein